ncbi:hypothetical protein KCU90_g2887, partial [Aureobasidium melanogenum]
MLPHRRECRMQVSRIERFNNLPVLVRRAGRALRRIEQRLVKLGLRDQLTYQAKQFRTTRELGQQHMKLAREPHGCVDRARS